MLDFSGRIPERREPAGTPFGKHRFYSAEKDACHNLGIEGADLYGGTRHSSATALRRHLSFADTKDLLGDVSEAALRYIQQDFDLDRSRYALVRSECNTDHLASSPGKLPKVKENLIGPCRIRTCDSLLKRQILYLLS